MSSKSDLPNFEFKITIPNLKDPDAFKGQIKHLTVAQNLKVPVPKRSGGKNGIKTVNILPPSVSKITFLSIRPDKYSDDCRNLICRPGPVSSTSTGSTDDSTQTPMDHQ